MVTPLTDELALRVIYVETDPNVVASFMTAFGQEVSINRFDKSCAVIDWLKAGNQADLFIINEQINWLPFIQEAQRILAESSVQFILTSAKITPELCQKALQAGVADVFPATFNEETIRLRFDYLIRKKRYYDSYPGSLEAMLYTNLPLWKRTIDLVVSVSALAALSPVMIVTTMLIRLDSPGPILYKSRRVGAGYRIFDMYKFRSMRADADQLLASLATQNIYETKEEKTNIHLLCDECLQLGVSCSQPLSLMGNTVCEKQYILSRKKAAFMKFREDPRVTRLGRFLRNTSIDELPQLLNIIKGDMSLVGNRPLPLYEAEKLTKKGYIQRFAAPAGLTGLWQVMKRAKGQPVMSDHERIQLDIQYAETLSFRTDLRILFKTLVAVWQKENV